MKQTLVILTLVCLAFAMTAWAQDTSRTEVTQEASTTHTETLSGTVVYVSGNDLVVKLDSGEVKQYTVAPGATAMADGKEITIKDVKPGMKLQKTITTATTPTYVQTIRTIKGRVWHVSPPKTVILTLPEGNKQYRIPEGQKFNINGEEKTAWELRKGMNVSATVITTVPSTEVAITKSVTGKMPIPATPPAEGALLVEEPKAPVQQAAAGAPALPKTASIFPLLGAWGLLLVGASFALRMVRT
jgi:hypothetical protein